MPYGSHSAPSISWVRIFRGLWRLQVRKSTKFAVLFTLALMFVVAGTLTAQTDWPGPDNGAISKFEDEGLQRSQIMEVMSYLSDVYGPRLTNSPNIREA